MGIAETRVSGVGIADIRRREKAGARDRARSAASITAEFPEAIPRADKAALAAVSTVAAFMVEGSTAAVAAEDADRDANGLRTVKEG
jgi:hypothetical protein